MIVSLLPLSRPDHEEALQQVYRATSGYWELYNLAGSPVGQAERDLEAAEQTPGRTLMGIVRHGTTAQADLSASNESPEASSEHGLEMIGMVDFRLYWPSEDVCYVGMVMVAEPFQRQGVGTQAWRLLEPWLAGKAGVAKARLAVEQFNPDALQFFLQLGFALTGESNRVEVGKKWVRILYMEKELSMDDKNVQEPIDNKAEKDEKKT